MTGFDEHRSRDEPDARAHEGQEALRGEVRDTSIDTTRRLTITTVILAAIAIAVILLGLLMA